MSKIKEFFEGRFARGRSMTTLIALLILHAVGDSYWLPFMMHASLENLYVVVALFFLADLVKQARKKPVFKYGDRMPSWRLSRRDSFMDHGIYALLLSAFFLVAAFFVFPFVSNLGDMPPPYFERFWWFWAIFTLALIPIGMVSEMCVFWYENRSWPWLKE